MSTPPPPDSLSAAVQTLVRVLVHALVLALVRALVRVDLTQWAGTPSSAASRLLRAGAELSARRDDIHAHPHASNEDFAGQRPQ